MSGYLETKNLSVGYHGKPLIEDVSLCVQRGKIVTLIGPNGSGKSTILKTVIGQLPELSGAVYLAALGGAGALMAKSVQTLEVIAWPDLGCEAVRRLTVRDMPLTVVLDAHGGDLYEAGPAAYLAAL